MNKDICVRCGEGVVNIRVGAIIIKDNKVLMVKSHLSWFTSSQENKQELIVVTLLYFQIGAEKFHRLHYSLYFFG